ncbi:MAG TPA: plastocyanin/azurin family copper-binding protein [Gaiellaceae bacterium]|nr:plastocyanin/azurin family copper-binding protein [Gaiellaceae bacterium]
MRAAAALGLLVPIVALLTACGGGSDDDTASPEQAAQTSETAPGAETAPAPVGGGDPRDGGFEVALGEWAVTPEANAIRPGPVTFVIVNRGEMPHGFEIELESEDSDDDRGKVETRILEPGASVEVELDLTEGVWKLECNVEGHDDLGMEMLLEVRADAPLTSSPGAGGDAGGGDGGAAVAIEGFVYAPERIEAAAGEEVEWTNHDPADHTVTAEDGSFDSGTMAEGATFNRVFDDPGEYRYICALHPGMKGVVVVR